MTTARTRLVDVSVTRWYHCITRCVRKALLLGDNPNHPNRKAWIERRLADLAEIFAVGVGGFAVMDNHLHLLVRLDPKVAETWTDEEVALRWGRLFPPRGAGRQALAVTKEWIDERLRQPGWVEKTRARLWNLGWFMKCLKEPLARMANREDGVKGAFFEGRFKSIAILDEESLLATCTYIDLNPVAAGIAEVPETSPHTSIKTRVDVARKHHRLRDLKKARKGSVAASKAAAGLEDNCWLTPIEDRRGLDSTREGMMPTFGLGTYLLLVDHTSRLFRQGKARVSRELAEIFTRLGTDAESWQARLNKLSSGRLLGRCLAASREKLRETAHHLGLHRLPNLAACPTR
jgi:REP element-mobilizing transposase RayT